MEFENIAPYALVCLECYVLEEEENEITSAKTFYKYETWNLIICIMKRRTNCGPSHSNGGFTHDQVK